MDNKRTTACTNKAQTAIELAVFGAIFIFIVTTIVRQALGFGYQQNQSLKAMRQAMMTSYLYSEGEINGVPAGGVASRNSASILFVEDRLTPDAGKYGAIDRVPYLIGARATHSKQLFQPVQAGEIHNLPMFDLFVNGKHIPLLVANFKVLGPAGSIPLDSTNPMWTDTDCAEQVVDGSVTIPDLGCVAFHTIIANAPASERWCIDDCPGLSPCCVSDPSLEGSNLPVDVRFDLDLDGASGNTSDLFPPYSPDPDVDNSAGAYPGYAGFAWQWYRVMAFDDGKAQRASFVDGSGNIVNLPVSRLKNYEGINMGAQRNTLLDVDRDGKEEQIVRLISNDGAMVTRLDVIDYQEGDLDFTIDSNHVGPRPGLQNDMNMYSFVRTSNNPDEGTYMLIEYGKLFNDNRQYVRTSSKKDQVDVVERIIQLSNDTDRFCDTSGGVTPQSSPWWSADTPNPVEVCCHGGSCSDGSDSCFTDGTGVTAKTCMDEDTLVIFVRSRITDLHGRKWVTDVTDDTTIDFNTQ